MQVVGANQKEQLSQKAKVLLRSSTKLTFWFEGQGVVGTDNTRPSSEKNTSDSTAIALSWLVEPLKRKYQMLKAAKV